MAQPEELTLRPGLVAQQGLEARALPQQQVREPVAVQPEAPIRQLADHRGWAAPIGREARALPERQGRLNYFRDPADWSR